MADATYHGGMSGEVDEVDYAEVFQRLVALQAEMKSHGASPALYAGATNLELALGNSEEALNDARSFLAMAETEEQKAEARYLVTKCQLLLRKHEKAKKKEFEFDE